MSNPFEGLSGEELARALLESGEFPYDEDGKLLYGGAGECGATLRSIYGGEFDELSFDTNQSTGDVHQHKSRPKSAKKRSIRTVSDYISEAQFRELHDAAIFCLQRCEPFNCEVTVRFFDDEPSSAVSFSKWLARYRDWCLQRSMEPVYLYVWEHPGTTKYHVHLALRVDQRFGPNFRGWFLESLPDVPLKQHKPVFRENASQISQERWLKYMLKGISPKLGRKGRERLEAYSLAKALGIPKPSPQGSFGIKRIGTSQSIGRARREAMSFLPCRKPSFENIHEFWPRLSFTDLR